MSKYIDQQGRTLFVHDGISAGRDWAVYYRKPSGSLRRVKSKRLPVCASREAAQRYLDGWAMARELRVTAGSPAGPQPGEGRSMPRPATHANLGGVSDGTGNHQDVRCRGQ